MTELSHAERNSADACQLCNGDGQDQYNTYARCARCDGSGYEPKDKPAGWPHNYVRCRACGELIPARIHNQNIVTDPHECKA